MAYDTIRIILARENLSGQVDSLRKILRDKMTERFGFLPVTSKKTSRHLLVVNERTVL